MHTATLLRWQQWAWIPHIFIIPGSFTFPIPHFRSLKCLFLGLTALWTYFRPTGLWSYDALTFSTLWRFIWILSLPNCMFAWCGFITPDWAHGKAYMDKQPVHVSPQL